MNLCNTPLLQWLFFVPILTTPHYYNVNFKYNDLIWSNLWHKKNTWLWCFDHLVLPLFVHQAWRQQLPPEKRWLEDYVLSFLGFRIFFSGTMLNRSVVTNPATLISNKTIFRESFCSGKFIPHNTLAVESQGGPTPTRCIYIYMFFYLCIHACLYIDIHMCVYNDT